MVSRYEYNGTFNNNISRPFATGRCVWVDLEQPTENELRAISREFSLNEVVEKELLVPTPNHAVMDNGSHVLAVLHFPTHGGTHEADKGQEIDFVVGDGFIITVRYEVVAPLHHLAKLFEARDLVSDDDLLASDAMFEVIFAHIYASVRDRINHITNSLRAIENDMFDGHERKTVRAISDINRSFLHLEAALADQEDTLRQFLNVPTLGRFLGDGLRERAERILGERERIMRLVRTHRAIATEVRETNIALLEARQNEIMRTLTMITVVVLPLELIAFIFGMHAPGTPLEQNPNAFWIIMGVMLGAITLMAAYFVRKRWIL